MDKQTHTLTRLRLQIVLSCILLTGVVLFSACLIAFRAAANETQRAADEAFRAQCRTVESFLSTERGVDTQALLQFSQQNRLIVAVNDSGTLLAFSERTLAEVSENEALQELFFAAPKTSFSRSSQEGSGRWYLSCNPGSSIQWYNILVFQSVDSLSVQRLLRTYGMIFAGGMLLLAAIAWVLSRRMIRPAETAQQEQLRFFAAASHELKSPLAVIASSVEMLQRGLGSPAPQYQRIQEETDRMAQLVDDMLILSGGGTGRWTLRLCSIRPEDVLLPAYEAYAELMETKGQVLRLRLPEHMLPMINANEQRLRQIVTILLDNAFHHTPPGTEILLCATQTRSYVVIQVVDHGGGIPDEEKKRVFQYFYQGGEQASHNFGLGLAVAGELARLHGASLLVSDTAGGGATFTLNIPQKSG